MAVLYYTNKLIWILTVLAHGNNSLTHHPDSRPSFLCSYSLIPCFWRRNNIFLRIFRFIRPEREPTIPRTHEKRLFAYIIEFVSCTNIYIMISFSNAYMTFSDSTYYTCIICNNVVSVLYDFWICIQNCPIRTNYISDPFIWLVGCFFPSTSINS